MVLVWVRAANINTVSRRKLLDNLYHTYTKERIEQLFNIIIEWPDSQAALEDVRVCLASTDLRGHLTKSLKRVLDNKLLHPGVNTADILTAYIAAIRYNILKSLSRFGCVRSISLKIWWKIVEI